MSNSVEAKVGFISDVKRAAVQAPVFPLLGGTLGVAVGVNLENAVTGNNTRTSTDNRISQLHDANHFMRSLQSKAAGNPGVQAFLREQSSANQQKITSLRAHEPANSGWVEDTGFIVSGGLLGAVVITAIVTALARAKRSLNY